MNFSDVFKTSNPFMDMFRELTAKLNTVGATMKDLTTTGDMTDPVVLGQFNMLSNLFGIIGNMLPGVSSRWGGVCTSIVSKMS